MKSTTFALSGLHCNACVVRVTRALAPLAEEVEVTLNPQQVVLKNTSASFNDLQSAVMAAGKYELKAVEAPVVQMPTTDKTWVQTYQPLLLIVGLIVTCSVVVQLGQSVQSEATVTWMETMRYFMAGFFLVFSFFKLLDIQAFATAYSGYDLLAAKWRTRGLIYPFVELGLGLSYLANLKPFETNVVTLLVMSFSAIGVIRAVMSKTKIQCACLGTVFQLPMSTVTIVEDVGMVVMAVMMLVLVP
jgi:copper chaperone CopZ